MDLEKWLQKLHDDLRKEDIDMRQRPFEAIKRYSIEFDTPIDISSEVATKIFTYFEDNSKPGVFEIGSLYESVYLYDSQLWSVSIPVAYGTVNLNPLDSLYQMPDKIKKALKTNHEEITKYVSYWSECLDYGYGINDLRKSSILDTYGLQLLLSGDEEIRVAVSILRQHRPDPRAIMSTRMALEMFLKAFIACKAGLTEKQAKAIGHNLKKAYARFIEVSGYGDMNFLSEELLVYPPIKDRYKVQELPMKQVWKGFAIAQTVGCLFMREFTDRNSTEQLFCN